MFHFPVLYRFQVKLYLRGLGSARLRLGANAKGWGLDRAFWRWRSCWRINHFPNFNIIPTYIIQYNTVHFNTFLSRRAVLFHLSNLVFGLNPIHIRHGSSIISFRCTAKAWPESPYFQLLQDPIPHPLQFRICNSMAGCPWSSCSPYTPCRVWASLSGRR